MTPVEDGDAVPEGITDYILHVEVAGMDAHNEWDTAPAFLEFLPKARGFQPIEPRVAFGTTKFSV